ncbi:pentapeptide repeat-containing protein [Flavobacteriaceae bacterium M23B6Z8]
MSEKQPLKPKTNNEKLIIGLIVGAVLGFLLYWALNVVTVHSETLFIILVVVAVLIALLFLLIIWFRNRLIRSFFGKDIAFHTVLQDTQETLELFSENATKGLPVDAKKKEQIRQFAPKLINYLLWSNFRNWGLRIFTSFVLGLGGIVTTILVLNQNKLFENQNKLFELQNTRIKQQTHLIEADRRSAQIFIMGEVLSDLNKELEDPKNTQRTLSNTLVGRIISLSRAMKPYRYLEGESLTEKLISPERGQLLIALTNSKIDNIQFQEKILFEADFSYAELKESNFKDVNLSFANLNYANFKDANLIDVNLNDAHLSGANLDSANLSFTSLSKADLRYASLRYLNAGNLDMSEAWLDSTDLTKANLINVNLFNSVLINTNLTKADLRGANLSYAVLGRIELKGANLRNTDLSAAVFSEIKNLDSVKVHRYDWLTYIKDSLKLEGAKGIYEMYKVDSVEYEDLGPLEKRPMLLRREEF